MPMKDLLHRLHPVQVYIVLFLSVVFFAFQLFLSHISHALTLLVNSYHMLCNIIALSGCILTIKHSRNASKSRPELTKLHSASTDGVSCGHNEANRFVEINITEKEKLELEKQRHVLKNTFGWTRIDVLTMLIVCIFLAALCFSLLVEALQTLVHIDHQDTMHYPILVLLLACIGLVLNGLCYLLIGGYTYHQGSFLHLTPTGDVVLDRITTSGQRDGERELTKGKKDDEEREMPKMQSTREMLRDISSSVFVIICSIIVYFADNEEVTKFVDPLISIISCFTLLYLSYPYMKEAGYILLQTIPDCIDIESFKKSLLESFQDIVSVHDLHIWQLTSSKYVSTAHIIFKDPYVYHHIMDDVILFFKDQGITIVTIQPEFQSDEPVRKVLPSGLEIDSCLVQCSVEDCKPKQCCSESSISIMNASVSNPNLVHRKPKRTSTASLDAIAMTVVSTNPDAGVADSTLSLDQTPGVDGRKTRSESNLPYFVRRDERQKVTPQTGRAEDEPEPTAKSSEQPATIVEAVNDVIAEAQSTVDTSVTEDQPKPSDIEIESAAT